ncbi:hypothetical protein ACONUD_02725 [Microbulbifer harenosus]|uniref:Uncharacterized protein n=1 Tax=Microbulbifer harenosus TaxID=2576840 RepID=A0ABY2UEA9_9GAMM|nr:hypothetical protein [Microbulbifer harenosus]TLM73430.1 hypothetical protein FDY93_18935 [Microbulbifer harenosus]
MSIALGKIIQEAIPLVEMQVGEAYDKYTLEKELRWHNPRPSDSFENVMPEIIAAWSVDDSQIILIEVICHDLHTRALSFNDVDELEEHMLSGSSYLNWYISYVVPIIGGIVRDFDAYTSDGEKIVKHVFDETSTSESKQGCKIEWKS